MTDDIPRRYDHVEVFSSAVRRRRPWTSEEKTRIVEETDVPGMNVSLVVRRLGMAGNQLFTWRRVVTQGALIAAPARGEVVPASDCRALEAQVRELQHLFGKRTTTSAALTAR